MIVGKDGKKLFHNVITSFNEAGYERYGRKFVETYLEHWPKNARLTIFYEGEKFDFTEGCSWHPIETVEYLPEYLNNLRFPIQHGIVGDKYDINFDARMGRKVFMQMHALKKWGGKVFWIDADTFTHADVPETFLDDVLPDGKFCCYLGRDGWYYTESGFIGFNADHPLAAKFYNNYLNTFISGVIFACKGELFGTERPIWHDCAGFDAVRHLLGNGPEFNNLASGLPIGTMHVQVNSVLGKYCDHRKGARKESRSTDKDLVIARDEEYWTSQGNG